MVIDSDTKMIPNDNFIKYYNNYDFDSSYLPDAPKFSRTISCGAFILIRKIAIDSGITKILNDIY